MRVHVCTALRPLLQVYLLDAVLRLAAHHVLLLLMPAVIASTATVRQRHGDALNLQKTDKTVRVESLMLLRDKLLLLVLILVGHCRARVELRLLDYQRGRLRTVSHQRHLLELLRLLLGIALAPSELRMTKQPHLLWCNRYPLPYLWIPYRR